MCTIVINSLILYMGNWNQAVFNYADCSTEHNGSYYFFTFDFNNLKDSLCKNAQDIFNAVRATHKRDSAAKCKEFPCSRVSIFINIELIQ